VLKLAVVFEVSASSQLRVPPDAMKRAIKQAFLVEQTIFELLPTGMTPEGFAVDRMEQAIRGAGVPGLTQSELTRAFQDMRHQDRQNRIKTLAEAGRVRFYQRTQARGRPTGMLVHSDFAMQHGTDFPADVLS
jgi:hypothetical protein